MRDRRFVATHRGGPLHVEAHRLLTAWAADCAERALGALEVGPSDDRPARAIEAARAWARGEGSVGRAREASVAAHQAARETSDPASRLAARAAAHAAATAHMADHCLVTAAYALKAAGARGASSSDEREWQDGCLPGAVRALVLSAREPGEGAV